MPLDASQVQLAAKIATTGRDGIDALILDLGEHALFGPALKVYAERFDGYLEEYGVGMIEELRNMFDEIVRQLKEAAKTATNEKSMSAALDILERVQEQLATLIPHERTGN